MSTRQKPVLLAIAAVLALATGCGGGAAAPEPLTVDAVRPLPPGAAEITSAPRERGDQSCDATASLRPGSLPAATAVPAGSPLSTIISNGRVRVGVSQDTYLFGYRNPRTGEIEGFDVDLARLVAGEVARALFGDATRIELRPIDSAERLPSLRDREVDLVAFTFSATCERRTEIEFSSTYFVTSQKLLAVKGSGIRSAADLGGKRVCAVFRTTTLETVYALKDRPTIIGMTNWLDCLTALQQGQVDAVSTDEPILRSLVDQDPNLEIVGDVMAYDSYALGIQKDNTDLVRYVNTVLERIRGDGTWERLYAKWMSTLGTSPGPPTPRYVE